MDTDIIIAGGGLVGNALAVALAQGGLRVHVIDPLPRAAQTDAAFDGRTSAISTASVRVLDAIGAWQHIGPIVQAIHDIRVCDQDKPGYVHYSDKDVGEPFGYIVENNILRRGLYLALEATSGITLSTDKVVGFTRAPGSITAELESGATIKAPLLVAADGRFSKLRDMAEIPHRVISYKQTAIVCVIEHEHPHDGLALEKFYPSGPFAILPLKPQERAVSSANGEAGLPRLPWERQRGLASVSELSRSGEGGSQLNSDSQRPHPEFSSRENSDLSQGRGTQAAPSAHYIHRSGIVWTESERDAPHYVALSDEQFEAELQSRVGREADNYWGKIKVVGKRFSYPLKLMHASKFYADRFVLVGDAAHGVHPIAGQGVNLGYRDVAVLSELLIKQRKLGLDLGAESVLAHYQRWRRFDSMSMTAGTDILTRLFSNNIPGVGLLRRAGLRAVEHMPPLKRYFMKHAMGLVGDLPTMLQDKKAG